MKFIKNLNTIIGSGVCLVFMMTAMISFVSCDPSISAYEFDLPEAGSIADQTAPSANFSATQSDVDWMTFNFSNLSSSATSYSWTFGDGNSSTDLDAVNTFPTEGVYTVTLTVSDDLGVSSTYSQDINVIQPEIPDVLIPIILEPGFDNGDDGDEPVGIDSRIPWKKSSLGGTIQITSSNGYHEGSYAAKLPKTGDRIGYQEISEFTPNTDYVLTFKYAFRDQDAAANGILNVAMVSPIETMSELAENTIEINTYTEDVTGVGNLTTGTITFNSGANTALAIFFFNASDEAYVDSFSITAD